MAYRVTITYVTKDQVVIWCCKKKVQKRSKTGSGFGEPRGTAHREFRDPPPPPRYIHNLR